jgi:biotin operon repressor
MEGWVKLHRKFLEWEWYDKSETVHLFLHCLLKANHKNKNYRGKIVNRGSFLTSRELLSKELGLSERQIRTSLNRLKLTKELTIKSSRQGTEIHIVNYSKYQIQSNKESNSRPTTDQQQTSNNNDNNENKVYRSFAHLTMSISEFEKLEVNYTKEQIDGVCDAIQNFKKNTNYKSLYLTAKNWLKKEQTKKEVETSKGFKAPWD